MSSTMRISFVLAREDNPRLYDELIQFPKGQRRVNRLRTIAYDGLLMHLAPNRSEPGATEGASQSTAHFAKHTDREQAAIEVFSDPLSG